MKVTVYIVTVLLQTSIKSSAMHEVWLIMKGVTSEISHYHVNKTIKETASEFSDEWPISLSFSIKSTPAYNTLATCSRFSN